MQFHQKINLVQAILSMEKRRNIIEKINFVSCKILYLWGLIHTIHNEAFLKILELLTINLKQTMIQLYEIVYI